MKKGIDLGHDYDKLLLGKRETETKTEKQNRKINI